MGEGEGEAKDRQVLEFCSYVPALLATIVALDNLYLYVQFIYIKMNF